MPAGKRRERIRVSWIEEIIRWGKILTQRGKMRSHRTLKEASDLSVMCIQALRDSMVEPRMGQYPERVGPSLRKLHPKKRASLLESLSLVIERAMAILRVEAPHMCSQRLWNRQVS